MDLENFIKDLSSEKPAPGGGGASAMFGVLGCALSSMVCALTIGKVAYDDYQDFVIQQQKEIFKLQDQLKSLIDEDARVYVLLNTAFKLPKDTDDQKKIREDKIQSALRPAAEVPLNIMKLSADAIDITESLIGKTSKMAVSDLGCAALGLKSAIQSAWLNVKINLGCSKEPMKDIEDLGQSILDTYTKKADSIYCDVLNLL